MSDPTGAQRAIHIVEGALAGAALVGMEQDEVAPAIVRSLLAEREVLAMLAHETGALAGVAAGPQATPRVLAEDITVLPVLQTGGSIVHLWVDTRPGTRVRVVAAPTDHTTVRVAEVRRPIPGARDMTGDAVPTDHEDQP